MRDGDLAALDDVRGEGVGLWKGREGGDFSGDDEDILSNLGGVCLLGCGNFPGEGDGDDDELEDKEDKEGFLFFLPSVLINLSFTGDRPFLSFAEDMDSFCLLPPLFPLVTDFG